MPNPAKHLRCLLQDLVQKIQANEGLKGYHGCFATAAKENTCIHNNMQSVEKSSKAAVTCLEPPYLKLLRKWDIQP